jgi:ribosomal protein L11 methyltransferase
MAFGTGQHPTTRLCLAALEGRVRPGARVLDVGTGSGILAIGAALLGAEAPVALDVDPRAVATAEANAALSGVALTPFAGTLPELLATRSGPFDVVLANLLAGLVIELARDLAAAAAPGGTLIASGILCDQVADVAGALVAAGFAAPETMTDGDWAALVARRAPDGP